jgi:hypothetical protein
MIINLYLLEINYNIYYFEAPRKRSNECQARVRIGATNI